MNTQNNTARLLASTVEDVIKSSNLNCFERYWDLYERTIDLSNVTSFFVRTEAQLFRSAYCNVVIVGDGLLIDISGDDQNNEGDFSVLLLNSISGISIHTGPLPGLADSQGARIVVQTELAGLVDEGPYWVAKTAEEEERLLDLVESLIESMSTR